MVEAVQCFLQQALAIREAYGLDASIDQQEAQIQAFLRERMAHVYFSLGDLGQAKECCQRGEHLLDQCGIEIGSARAKILLIRGFILWRDGSFSEALTSAQQSYQLLGAASMLGAL